MIYVNAIESLIRNCIYVGMTKDVFSARKGVLVPCLPAGRESSLGHKCLSNEVGEAFLFLVLSIVLHDLC